MQVELVWAHECQKCLALVHPDTWLNHAYICKSYEPPPKKVALADLPDPVNVLVSTLEQLPPRKKKVNLVSEHAVVSGDSVYAARTVS